MPPKPTRNLGEKTEGMKVTRVGRDKGELTGANKRLTAVVAKPAVENMSSLGRGAKTSDNTITPPTEIKVKGKSQSTIVTFLAGGAQDIRPAHIIPPSESNMVGTESIPSIGSMKECTINNDPPLNFRQGMESMPELEGDHRETRGKGLGPSTENKQPQAQQYDWSERLEHQDGEGGVFILRPATEGENSHKALANTKNVGRIVGKDPQTVEWGRDNSDTFYSLTEESDLSSGDHSLGGSEDSETSETEDKTSSNEPTVQQLRRHRKSVKTRSCSQGSPGNPPSTGSRSLKWDYSGIGLADSSSITNQGSAKSNKETDIGPSTYSPSAIGAEAGMLQSIYSSIKELQTETRIESRSARIATKKLQGTVRKVAKSCTEIETKLSLMEERIVAVEEDVVNLKEQNTMRDEQLTDVMWKLEDFENRQRRNNLRILGIPEGLEGSNIRTYMITFLRDPDLLEEWRTQISDCSFKLMGTLITQAKQRMEEQIKNIEDLMKELEKVSNQEEVQMLLGKMEERVTKQEEEIKKRKAHKFNRYKLDYEHGRIYTFARKYDTLRIKEKMNIGGDMAVIYSKTDVSSDPG
ncbi:hypothetical protein NDU88_002165 [Pleurodeles waltl]|uniref:Uncharacterized protein n=1 Tax=Pleurodeles waltl TaxID=8319 RepID=A0AAV7UUX4_PLEWA|nr:hypothetical protein NDU88_002165 [Pleurodeles waltl]